MLNTSTTLIQDLESSVLLSGLLQADASGKNEAGHNQNDTENICKYTKQRRRYQTETKRDSSAGERHNTGVEC